MSDVLAPESLHDSGDMTPEQFSDINERILVELFGQADAEEHITLLRELKPDTDAVANYVMGAVLAAHKQDEFVAAITKLLEPDTKKE